PARCPGQCARDPGRAGIQPRRAAAAGSSGCSRWLRAGSALGVHRSHGRGPGLADRRADAHLRFLGHPSPAGIAVGHRSVLAAGIARGTRRAHAAARATRAVRREPGGVHARSRIFSPALMSVRSRQRAARCQALQLRCARQREQLADSLLVIQRHLQPIDRTLMAIRSVRRTTLLMGALVALAAAAATLFTGRTRRPRASRLSWLLPLAGPVLKLLGTWWRERHAATAAPAAQPDA